jgi:hypothetical protein
MSRAALFLSIGYPPESLTPNQNDAKLTYQSKRYDKIAFQFDDRTASLRSGTDFAPFPIAARSRPHARTDADRS